MATKPSGQRGQHHKRKILEPVYSGTAVVGYKFMANGRMLYLAREKAKPDNIELSDAQLLNKCGLPSDTITKWRKAYDDPLRGEYPPGFKDIDTNYFTSWWDQAVETYSSPVTDLLLAIGLDRANQDYRYWKTLMESYGLVKQGETQVNVLAIPVNLDRIDHLKAEDYDELRKKLLDTHRGVESGAALVNSGELAMAGTPADRSEREDSGAEEVQGGRVLVPNEVVSDDRHARQGEPDQAVPEPALSEDNS